MGEKEREWDQARGEGRFEWGQAPITIEGCAGREITCRAIARPRPSCRPCFRERPCGPRWRRSCAARTRSPHSGTGPWAAPTTTACRRSRARAMRRSTRHQERVPRGQALVRIRGLAEGRRKRVVSASRGTYLCTRDAQAPLPQPCTEPPPDRARARECASRTGRHAGDHRGMHAGPPPLPGGRDPHRRGEGRGRASGGRAARVLECPPHAGATAELRLAARRAPGRRGLAPGRVRIRGRGGSRVSALGGRTAARRARRRRRSCDS